MNNHWVEFFARLSAVGFGILLPLWYFSFRDTKKEK